MAQARPAAGFTLIELLVALAILAITTTIAASTYHNYLRRGHRSEAVLALLAVAVACLPVFFTGHRIARWEGALFLAYYIAYAGTLVMMATGSELLPSFRFLMNGFVLPLTALTLVVITVRAVSASRRAEPTPPGAS